MNRLSGILIVALFAMLTVAAWGFANRPSTEPALPRVINGFAFQPYQKDQDAIAGIDPTVEQIDGDLELLAGTARAVRTYSALGTLGEIPGLADRHDLKVMLGSWIDADRVRNEREIGLRSASPTRIATYTASSWATKWCCAATCRFQTCWPISIAYELRPSSRSAPPSPGMSG